MMSPDLNAEFPIVVSQLTKTYRLGFWMNRRVTALRGVDLRVPRGTIYGLLGPNGAGKSTTIKILLDLVRATGGAVTLMGLEPRSPLVAQHIGFVPENPAPYEYLTGREFLRLSGQLAGLRGQELDTRVDASLGEVDLSQAAAMQVRRYSKGMVQRLALAHGLLNRPKLLILDEPTSGLDPIGRRQIRDIILAQRDRGTTVLLCTHIIPDVEAVCDRIAILVGGRLLREGNVRELLQSTSHEIELVVEGLNPASFEGQALGVTTSKQLGDRLLVRLPEESSQRALRLVLGAGGRVVSLTPIRGGVEDLFLSAVREAGRTVGAEVQ